MFWDRFYNKCKELGTSPNAVCKSIGLSNAAATGWKNGTLPKADVLAKLADTLNCSVDYLLERDPAPQNPDRKTAQELLNSLSADQVEHLVKLLNSLRDSE